MDRIVGILGGMGSAASETFYKMVVEMTDAARDQDHVNMVIYNDAGMPDRTKAILEKNYDEVRERMLRDIHKLEDFGCEAVGVTCNTAHFFVDMLEGKFHIPVIHMIKETVRRAAVKNPGGKTAVLATDGTIKTELYQKYMEEAGLEPFIPAWDIQAKVMYEIYDRIKEGRDADRDVWEKIDRNIRNAGCVMAILGCTELSVIKEQLGLGDFYMDPMRVLAKLTILFSGKKLKREYEEII